MFSYSGIYEDQAGLDMSVNPVNHHLLHTCALARENEQIEKKVCCGVVCAGVQCTLCIDWSRQCFVTAATILLFVIAHSTLLLFSTLLYLHVCVLWLSLKAPRITLLACLKASCLNPIPNPRQKYRPFHRHPWTDNLRTPNRPPSRRPHHRGPCHCCHVDLFRIPHL